MPFTPSHAVVALPFVRTPLLPAAIAVGAMAPDLPLFLRGTPVTYHLTHTNVLAAAVVGAVLLAFWYVLLRPAVRELLPAVVARRLPVAWDENGARLWHQLRARRTGGEGPARSGALFGAVVALSLLLGALTHVLWDAFTHEGRWGVLALPVLDEMWGPLLGYKWLQYGSGVLGLAVIVVYGIGWWRRQPVSERQTVLPEGVRVAWWVSLPLVLAVAWIGGLVAHGPLRPEFTPAHLGYLVLPPACAVWAAGTAVLCAVVQLRRSAHHARSH